MEHVVIHMVGVGCRVQGGLLGKPKLQNTVHDLVYIHIHDITTSDVTKYIHMHGHIYIHITGEFKLA